MPPDVVPIQESRASGFSPFETRSGQTLVNQDRRVIEYFVDLESPDDGDFEDVTSELGPKDPSHPASDVKDLITMSLVFYDAQRSKAA